MLKAIMATPAHLFFLLFLFQLKLFFPADLHASAYSFGGVCESQGAWTKQALTQSNLIRDAINQLKSDPNCMGIESILPEIQTAAALYRPPENLNGSEKDTNRRWENLSKEISSLNSVMSSGETFGGKVYNVLMNKTVDNAILSMSNSQLKVKTSRAVNTGLDILDNALKLLPQYDECLYNNPNQSVALFGATLKLTSAFISSDETMIGRIGDSISNLVTFLRQKRFSKILRQLNETEFWMSLSCIVETTTEVYCSAKDGYEMLRISEQLEKESKNKSGTSAGNPLEGYHLMVREVPIISTWLQKVQFGVTPRLKMDAAFKNLILDNINELIKTQNKLLGYYSDAIQLLEKIPTLEAKKNHVFNMVKQINNIMARQERADINFFTMSTIIELMPFKLIGRDEIPAACASNEEGRYVMPWDKWMQNGGNFQPEFDNPELLATTIGIKMNEIIETALENGGAYYQQRLIIDTNNLVDKSLTSQTLTVFESLKNVRAYLDRLGQRLINDRTELAILPNIIDTIRRIDEIIKAYDDVRDIVEEYLNGVSDPTYDRSNLYEEIVANEQLRKAFAKIVDVTYRNFNVLFQRDTFLLTRMDTFVRFDYSYQLKYSNSLNDYQKELMVIAGKNLLNRLQASHQHNPALTELDLNSAQIVNKRNLDAVEQLFSDNIVPVIAELNLISRGEGNSTLNVNLDAFGRFFVDAFAPTRLLPDQNDPTFYNIVSNIVGGPFRLVGNFFYHNERYAGRSWGTFSKARVATDDDMYGSFGKLRSKLCIQTMAFENKDRFIEICEGSKLVSRFESENDHDVNLKVSYDDLLEQHRKALLRSKKSKDRFPLRANKDQNICALRNYKRKNYVYWLIKKFSNDYR